MKNSKTVNLLIAIDSFKGSLDTMMAGRAVGEAAKETFENACVTVCPLADGGEGTMDAVIASLGGKVFYEEVTGPLGEKVSARYGIVSKEKLAIIEMAEAAGLPLVPKDKRDPKITTTRGVGELILHTIKKHGCRRFLVGIGGSATNDGGVGMLKALGFEFLDKDRNDVPDGAQGLGMIETVVTENVAREILECEFMVACDVNNPLCGERGASAVYGPQKGASEDDVKFMDDSLAHFAALTEKKLGNDFKSFPGAGAAGGMGFALATFLDAKLVRGVDLILDAVGLDKALSGADLVITGEGRLDGQTAMGKAPIGVAKMAKRHGIPVIALSGCIGDGAEELNRHGIDAFFPILRRITTLEEAINEDVAYDNLKSTARQVFLLLRSVK